MKEWFKSNWGWFVAIISGIVATAFYFLTKHAPPAVNPSDDPFADMLKKSEEELDESEKVLDNLDKNGVEDLNKEDVVDYWNRQ